MLPFKLWSQSVRLQDVKLFLLGMCIVLIAEITMDVVQRPPDCSQATSENHSPFSYFGSLDTSYAKKLASSIHVFCFILTDSSQFASQYHVQNTWVRRCTRYGFVAEKRNRLLRVLNANHGDPSYKRKSWNSLRVTLKTLYTKNEPMSFYLKADYDTYIIMENVRFMLEFEDPNTPFLLGHVHERGIHGDKISGSAGYVLSRKALQLIVTEGLDNKTACGEIDRDEDVQISLCAESVGVDVRDSLDFLGKSRFTNVTIYELLGPYPNNTPRWYPAETDYTLPKYDLHKLPASPLLVSFAGINSTMMYVLEYLLYHLRPTGITHKWLYEQA